MPRTTFFLLRFSNTRIPLLVLSSRLRQDVASVGTITRADCRRGAFRPVIETENLSKRYGDHVAVDSLEPRGAIEGDLRFPRAERRR